MEQFNVINHLGTEVQLPDRQTYISQNTKTLNREICRMHFRHLGSWLLRATAFSFLLYLGTGIIGGEAGAVLTWTAGFLLAYLLLYIARGHSQIQHFREAKIYWLLDDATHVEFPSDDLSEASPASVQKPSQSNSNLDSGDWMRDHAFS